MIEIVIMSTDGNLMLGNMKLSSLCPTVGT